MAMLAMAVRVFLEGHAEAACIETACDTLRPPPGIGAAAMFTGDVRPARRDGRVHNFTPDE
jgi:hypothetical protein